MDTLHLKAFTDRYQVVEHLNNFGVALDQRNWDSFRSLFASSVKFDYSSIGDTVGILSPNEIVDNARGIFDAFEATQHFITNHVTEFESDVCTCRAYVRAMHLLPNDRGEPWFEIGGYYDGELVCVETDWKIQSWKFSVYWSRGNNQLFELAEQQ